MSRVIVISGGMALAVCVGFLASRLVPDWAHAGSAELRGQHGSPAPHLDWLRQEFDLDEAEFERVSALHSAYLPTCEALCKRILAARNHVQSVALSSDAVTPEVEAALQETAKLRAECQAAMLEHLYETAGALSAEKERKYLEMMLPVVFSMMPKSPEHGVER